MINHMLGCDWINHIIICLGVIGTGYPTLPLGMGALWLPKIESIPGGRPGVNFEFSLISSMGLI